jgi:hypothetical protein
MDHSAKLTRVGRRTQAAPQGGVCIACGHQTPARSIYEWAWFAAMIGASPGLWDCGGAPWRPQHVPLC